MKKGIMCTFWGILIILINIIPVLSWGAYNLTGVKYDTQSPVWSICSSDLDGDQKEETVLGNTDHHIYVVNETGRELWKFDVRGLPLDLALGDVNGDGRKEIIVASQDDKGTLYVLEYQKGILWTYSGEYPFLSVAIGDIDADGKNEVLAGSFAGMIYALEEQGRLKWKRQIAKESSIGALAVGDILGDRCEEIVCGTRKQGIWAMNAMGDTLWCITPRSKGPENHMVTRHWIRSVIIDDLDKDGKNEVVIGSRPAGMVTVADGHGKIIWNRNFPKFMNKSANAQVAVGNITGDEKKEIVCLLHGIITSGKKGTSPIAILDAQGTIILKEFPEKNFYSTSIGPKGANGYSDILFSSSTRGHGFYKVEAVITQAGNTTSQELFARVPDNIDGMKEMIRRIEMPKKEDSKNKNSSSSAKIHILYPYKADLNQASIERLMDFLKQLESPNLCFELMITHMYETKRGILDLRKQPKWTQNRGTHAQQEILKAVRLYESLAVPFYVLIGKQCLFLMHLDTMEAILEAAPNFCRGFMINEDIYSHGRKFENFHEKLEMVLDLLLAYGGKKLIMDEYLDYWAKVPTMPTIGKTIFNEKYRDVLVPMYKTNRFIIPEQNIGMIVGLWKAGITKEWGYCANDDLWKWESVFMNPPDDVILRMEVMAASLGATYFRIEAGREFIEERDSNWVISEGAKRHRDLFHTLIRKCILKPVHDPWQVIISPVMFQENYNKALMPKAYELDDDYWQRVYQLEGPLAYRFPLQAVNEDYLPSYVYHMDNFYDGLFPKTSYGFVGIVPEWIDPREISGIKDYWVIDGQFIYKKDSKKYRANQAKETLSADFQQYAEELPFQADGLFLSINKLEDGYQLFLMDPGHLDISEINATLKINIPEKNPRIIDVFSGDNLQCRDGELNIQIPAGVFRILKVFAQP